MGWERKRGKLHELNCLILAARGKSLDIRSRDTDSSFPIREGDLSFLQHVRYIITLDADTILPRDAAQELIAVLAHPLNRARLKPVGTGGCGEEVVSGYTILQPRTDINPLSSGTSYLYPHLLWGYRSRPLHTGYIGRLPGPLRRRQLCRQGRIRGRQLRAQPGRLHPRKCPAQPRPARRYSWSDCFGDQHRPDRRYAA